MVPLFRHIRIPALLAAAAIMFCCGSLHAAWNLQFPFYHEEQSPTPPVKPTPVPAPVPVAKQPVVPPAAPLQRLPIVVPVVPAPQLPLVLPSVVIALPPSPEPAEKPPVRESIQPASPLAPFDDAQRITARVFNEDTFWQDNVQLDGWVTIAPQATLTIAPGTTVRVAPRSGLNVLGRLVVKGSAESPVLFASLSSEPLPGEWRGIILTGSEKRNLLEYLRIEGAETGLLVRYSAFTAKEISISRTFTALQLQESVADIRSGQMTGSGAGIIAANSELNLDSVTIERNRSGITLISSSLQARDLTLSGNRVTGLSAEASRIRLERCSVKESENGARIIRSEGGITASAFRNNSETGALFAGSRMQISDTLFTGNRIGLQCDDNLPVLWNNAIFNNRSYNLLYMGEEAYFAGGNWLGSDSRESIDRSVFSRHAGSVQIEPLLEKNPVEAD